MTIMTQPIETPADLLRQSITRQQAARKAAQNQARELADQHAETVAAARGVSNG